MSIESINDAAVTDAVIEFFRSTADLSSDGSGNVGAIRIGDHRAPNPGDNDTAAAIEIVSGIMRPYLVVYQVALGAAFDRAARSGYAGGTPSTKLMRWQLMAVALQRDAAQSLAVHAAARITDTTAPEIVVDGHELSRWERVGQGAADREGRLFQWTELVQCDVARAL